MLSRSLTNDKLLLDVDENEMSLELEGDFSRKFHLPLIDVSDGEKELKLPSQSFDAKVEINARLLKEALKDAQIFGSTVLVSVKDNRFWIEAKGSQGNLKTVSKQGTLISVKGGSNVTSKYSLNFLSNIVKEADNDTNVLLEFKSDAPMRITYSIGRAKMQYYLAHMIL
jgi:DNA polymerase III sliding clamp (beta) subunit (PCNA family)